MLFYPRFSSLHIVDGFLMNVSPRFSVRERAKYFESGCKGVSNNSLVEIESEAISLRPSEEKANVLKSASQIKRQPPPIKPKPTSFLTTLKSMDRESSLSNGSENMSTSSGVDCSDPSNGFNDNSSDNVVSDEVLDPRPKLEKVVEEFVTTEETYLLILEIIIRDFPSAMTNLPNGEPNLDTIKGILRIDSLQPIQQFHADYLYPEFKKRLEDWSENPSISDIILSKVKFFKVYTPFVVNQDDAIGEFDRLVKFYPDFKLAVEDFRQQMMKEPHYETIKNIISFRFSELIRAPFNRLFHYRNLLDRYSKELGKSMNGESDDELENASKAIAEMTSVINGLNVQMKNQDQFQKKLKVLNSKITDLPDFFKDKELKLVREGQLMKRSRKADQIRHVVLFDTHLIVAKRNALSEHFSLNHTYDISRVKASVDEHDPKSFALSVPLPSSSSTFRTASPIECDQWVQDIENCRNKLGDKSDDKSLRLPAWKPDHMFTNCTICAKRFSTVHRKHHCRFCGLVYCEACSNHKWALKENSYRICSICFSIVQIDWCPSATLPESVQARMGSDVSNWTEKSHAEKWQLFKDDFLVSPSTGIIPFNRQIIAASLTCAKSGYVYVEDQRTSKFLSVWLVVERESLALFEACQNTVALDVKSLRCVRCTGPTPIQEMSSPELKQSAESCGIGFILKCSFGNSPFSNSSFRQMASKPRRSLSSTLSKVLGSPDDQLLNSSILGGSISPTSNDVTYVFGTEEEYEAEEWLEKIKKVSQLIESGEDDEISE